MSVPARPVVLTMTATSTAVVPLRGSVYQPDYTATPFQVTIQNTVTGASTASLAYNVEFTNNDISTLASSLATWWSTTGSSGASSNAFVSIAFPVRGISINITASSTTTSQSVTSTIIQSG